jgi:hypothetical protein
LHIAEGSFQLKNAAPAEPTADNLAIMLFVFNGLFVNLNTTTHYSPIKVRAVAARIVRIVMHHPMSCA